MKILMHQYIRFTEFKIKIKKNLRADRFQSVTFAFYTRIFLLYIIHGRFSACGQTYLNYSLSTRGIFFGFLYFRNIHKRALKFVNMNLYLKINFFNLFVFYLKIFEKKSACGQIYLLYRLSTRIRVRIQKFGSKIVKEEIFVD